MARLTQRERRTFRVRHKLKSVAGNKKRLSIFVSNAKTYAQIIDDVLGVTLAFGALPGKNVTSAREVGKVVAQAALSLGIEEVVFDRGPYLYHGRVKALAEAAREAGLKF